MKYPIDLSRLASLLWRPLHWQTDRAISLTVSRASGRSTRIKFFDKPMYRRGVLEVERTSKGFNIYTDRKYGRRLRKTFRNRAHWVLELLQHPDCIATKTTVCIGEGVASEDADHHLMIAFCATPGQAAALIPDYSFLQTKGYTDLRQWADLNWQEWTSRDPTVLWRGATTGSGDLSNPEMIPDQLLPRIQLCLLAKKILGTDMKITDIVQSKSPDLDRDRLAQAGIMGTRLPVEAWARHKFAVDIDGNSNSFGTMLCRLILGCCVLKVGSSENWRQWFYDSLVPWVHFIPIELDLSDLKQTIAWCREHDLECRQIAANGRTFANEIAYEAEKKAAVQRINVAFARPAS